MTFVSNSGAALTPANGAAYWENHIANLRAAGHTLSAWSDGTTVFTSGSPTAGYLAHTSAWAEMSLLDGSFYTWQRGTTNTTWRLKEAVSAFSTGRTATATGSSTTEALRVGGGTDAAPTYTNIMGTDGSYRQHTIADNAAPYYCHTIGPVSGTGAEANGGATWIHDPTTGAPTADTRAWVTIVTQNTGNAILLPGAAAINDDANAAVKAWLGFATTPTLVNVGAATRQLQAGAAAPGGVGTDSANNADDGVAIDYWRRSALAAPNGFKGVSTQLRWQGTVRSPISDIASQITPSIIIYRMAYASLTLPAMNLTHAL